ncbi:YetF domain-containing protein [Clostridium polynesiense]|uniref:YetF domain-containing protein n=1 Tax=Clostridium polynesiense TaxID=1325933 RepID=UPI00058B1133|nr:DUF421 domain-containing protein [Clostridium polynesiense]
MIEGLVVAVRSVIGFFSLLIFARILGKQQISQLNFFDYVLGITIGSIAASLTTDLSSRAWPHWIGLLTWAALGLLMEYAAMKWRYCGKYIDGEPTIIIMKGKILEEGLKKVRYRVSDIMELLRNKDVFNLNEVEFAIIEPNGQLSVLKKAEQQPVTKKDLNLSSKPVDISTEIIYDGLIFDENLKNLKLDRNWLKKELNKQGIKNPEEVFLATIDHNGELYVDKYKDYINNGVDIGDYKGPY